MFTAAHLALADMFSPRFRSVMAKSLLVTIGFLVAVWIVLQTFLAWVIDIDAYPWLDLLVSFLTGAGLLIGLAFLIGPAGALFAGFFTDRIAKEVEAVHYSLDPPGRELSFAETVRDAVGFTAVTVVVNLIALALLLVPVVGLVAFLAGNGYLLGREFFEAVARRYLSREDARKARQANRGKLFLAGLGIAGLMVVPVANLATPLFATAFMLHFCKRMVRPVPKRWLDFDTDKAK